MKGARALASGMLVLASICAVPAISAAQDTGTTATTTTTATTPAEPAQPVDPGGSTSTAPSAGGPGAGTPTEPQDQSGTPSPPIGDRSPATGPPGGGAARKAASASVNAGDFFFAASSVTIAVGDTVTWHNTGQAPHNATGDGGSFSTGTINPGGSASHTFNSAGTFSYICTIHPQMKATVRVLSSSSGSGGGGGGAGSSGSGTSESSAVASPDAAGTATTLPMTGMAIGALALVGAALLASGLIVRRASEEPRRRWLSIF